MPRPSRRAALTGGLAAALLLPAAVALPLAGASTPEASTLAAPDAPGTTTSTYAGEAPPGAFATSSCEVPQAPLADTHELTYALSPAAASLTQSLTFGIAWEPVSPAGNDLVLTVLGPDGAVVGSADSSSPSEVLTVDRPEPGAYTVAVCGFASPTPQPYAGTVTASALAPPAPEDVLPTVDRGLGFTATTPSDAQKSQGEPAITTDLDGTIYTCGTNGASNATDHASVSTDGGETFRIVGTPPTGTLGTGQGGGDCALATAPVKPEGADGYPLAYAGLGPLTGFSTATSTDNGRTLNRSVTQNETVIDALPGVDRQWIVFTDEDTAFLNYNELLGGQVVQRSENGGLTYGAPQTVATDGGRLGQLRAVPGGTYAGNDEAVVYFPYDSGSAVKLAMSQDGGTTWSQCLVAETLAPPTAGFTAAAHDAAGNLYVTWAEKGGGRDAYLVALRAEDVAGCAGPNPVAMSAMNDVDPGWTEPLRLNREGIETTVMPWVAAGGEDGRVAVAYYGTPTAGDPDLAIPATWHVYVSQVLDPFAATPSVDQAQATTHPFHYDSICLNGLACDTSVPAGDRSLVDYFTMEYDPAGERLVIVYSQPAKVAGQEQGNLSTPAVLLQRSGPSHGGGTLAEGRPVLDTAVDDTAGDGFANYTNGQTVAGSVPLPSLPSAPQDALDLLGVEVGPEVDLETGAPVPDGGFTVTMRVADLSDAALQEVATATGNLSQLYTFRYVDGYQASAVTAYHGPMGWSFGLSGYEVTAVNAFGSVLVYPGGTPVDGVVDAETGTIRISVPRDLVTELAGPTGPEQRPVEQKAVQGSRLYDATAFVLLTASPDPRTHTFLDTADSTAGFDFLIGAASAGPGTPVTPPGGPGTPGGPGGTPGGPGGTPGATPPGTAPGAGAPGGAPAPAARPAAGGARPGVLAATGLPVVLPLVGLVMLGAAVALRRRDA